MTNEVSTLVQDVAQIDPEGRRWLEKALGRPLRSDERVFVHALIIPDAETRKLAQEAIARIQEDVEANLRAAGRTYSDAEKAIDETLEAIRRRDNS